MPSAAMTLQVPSDGSAQSLRALLTDLDESIADETLSIYTPDLDDVFFALTGASKAKENHE